MVEIKKYCGLEIGTHVNTDRFADKQTEQHNIFNTNKQNNILLNKIIYYRRLYRVQFNKRLSCSMLLDQHGNNHSKDHIALF